MRDLMINIFGIYQPVQYVTSSGESIIPSGMAGVDWTFVLGIFLFGLFLYSIMRILGGAISAVNRH